MSISHVTRTVLLTGDVAGLRDECTHNKHTEIIVGTVNRQYNETGLFLREHVGLLSLPVVFIVDEGTAARVYAMKACGELEVRPH